MSSVQKQRVRLTPNNQPSGNAYSAQNFPAINFVIGRQRAFLDPRTLRLSGQLTVKNNVNASVVNDTTQPSSATNGATLNNFIGVSSLFDECTISTLNGRNLETVRNYNRLMALGKPLMNNSLDYNNGLGLKDPMQTDKSLTNAKTVNVEHDFSIPIQCGMFDSDKLINISDKGMHGLQIDLLLAQNAGVIQPYFRYTGVRPTDKEIVNAGVTFNYEIKNLSLTFDLTRLDDRTFNQLPSSGLLTYNSVSTLHSTLLSQDQTINLRFGNSNVLSVSHSIIPALNVNNINVDSFALGEPRKGVVPGVIGTVAKVKNVQYMRAGQLFPYNFMLDSEAQADLGNALGNASPQAQIMKPFQNSVSLYEYSHTKLTPLSNIGINSANAPAGGALPLASGPDPNSIFGLGTAMDCNRQGVSFKDREYAIRIQSELDDTTANSFFTFSRNRNVAQYSPTGITVLE